MDSPGAVTTLQSKGFNVFMIPGGLSHSTIQSTLQAITSPAGAIVMLNGFTDADASAFVYWIISIPEYSRVLAFSTFSEPNWPGQFVDVSRQRGWYAGLKSIDPSKPVVEIFHANGCGVVNKQYVDATPGLSWDVVMVFMYPYWWNLSDAQAISNLQFAANDTASYFNAAGGTFIIPLQQAAGCSVAPPPTPPACGEVLCLRPPPNAMDEYNVWLNSGCLNTSHSLFYYGWGTSEDQNLQIPAWLDAAAAQITYHKSLFP